MKYEVFLSEIKKGIEKLCPNDTIVLEKVVKNNALELDGLVIMKEGVCISPTVYLNNFYLEFLNGRNIESIAAEIVEMDMKSRNNIDIDPDEYTDFNKMRGKILYKLVNRERNAKFLEGIPYREYLDFAVIYYCLVTEINGGIATWIISNEMVNMWHVEEENLFEEATRNGERIMPHFIKNMMEMLEETFKGKDKEKEEILAELHKAENAPVMYFVSNERKLFGASVILYPSLLVDFSKKFGSFYMLPSSIHEVIFMPDTGNIRAEELRDMVIDVNNTQVSRDEFLSNEVYYFDAQAKQLHILNK